MNSDYISTVIKLPSNVKAEHVLALIAASCGNEILHQGNPHQLMHTGLKVDLGWLKYSDSYNNPEFCTNKMNFEGIKVKVKGKHEIDLYYYFETKEVLFETYWAYWDRYCKYGEFTPALAFALSIRLVSFFGGEVCFEYRDDDRVDFKQKPKTDRENNPSRSKDLFDLKSRILKLNPVNREELRKAKKLYKELYKEI